MALAHQILRRVRGHGRGFVFSAGDMLDLGTRAATDQALRRLAQEGTIRRIDRGLYDLPRIHGRIGPLWPSADAVARALARRTDSSIKPSGAMAANLLGLSDQVPAKAVYLTDGPSRTVRVGRLAVSLRHAGRLDMLLPGSKAGLAISALKYLGRRGTTPDVIATLARALDDADKARLTGVRRKLPAWMASAVDQIAASSP